MYKMFLKYTLYPCCCKMLQTPLILYHYKSYSISLPLCSQHPLLAVNILPLSSLNSPVSYLFFCLHLSPISLPFSPSSSHFHAHSSFVTITSPSVFSLSTPLSSSSTDHKAMRVPWWDVEGGRERSLVLPMRRREMMRESGALSG